MDKTFVILDGLQDPRQGRWLSARWHGAGFTNAVDVAGQCAWLTLNADRSADRPSTSLTESDINEAAAMARTVGLALRDRVGNVFRADNDLTALRDRITQEYRSRLAVALVFGCPALVLHHLGPILAGGGRDASSMALPWLIELLLVGWMCLAAGWPILWQGALALIHRRGTGDLLTSLLVAAAVLPSAWGVLSLAWTNQPWFGSPSGNSHVSPAFDVVVITMILALLQRWLVHRQTHRLSGWSDLMISRFATLIGAWLILSGTVGLTVGWRAGLAMGILLPPLAGLGAINPWCPGWSSLLAVFAFTGVFLLGPGVMAVDADGLRVPIAAGFGLIMTIQMAAGWRRLTPRPDASR